MKIELSHSTSWIKWIAIASFVLVVGFAAYRVQSDPVKQVPRNSLNFHTVQNGSLDIYADVYGELISAREQLLTAPAMGNVTEILALPGTQVTPDTPILRLSNPQLEQKVSQARGLLAEKRAAREAFKYEQKNDLLNFQGQIEDIKSEIEKATLEQSVQQNLLERGVASVIELKRADLSVKQQSARLEFEKRKYEQFIEMQTHKLKQMDITLAQQQAATKALEKQLASMFLRAGMSGSLQSLEVELGENVQLGQALARVGSNRKLIARLRLPRNKADQIDIEAPVIIDTQKGLLSAKIRRIESVVTDGFVRADAVIESELTSNARPSLAISAKVFVEHKNNVIYVKQASGFRPNSRQALFVMSDNDHLLKREITFGPLSFKNLVVTDGLNPGEKLVSGDTEKFEKFDQLAIQD